MKVYEFCVDAGWHGMLFLGAAGVLQVVLPLAAIMNVMMGLWGRFGYSLQMLEQMH